MKFTLIESWDEIINAFSSVLDFYIFILHFGPYFIKNIEFGICLYIQKFPDIKFIWHL